MQCQEKEEEEEESLFLSPYSFLCKGAFRPEYHTYMREDIFWFMFLIE